MQVQLKELEIAGLQEKVPHPLLLSIHPAFHLCPVSHLTMFMVLIRPHGSQATWHGCIVLSRFISEEINHLAWRLWGCLCLDCIGSLCNTLFSIVCNQASWSKAPNYPPGQDWKMRSASFMEAVLSAHGQPSWLSMRLESPPLPAQEQEEGQADQACRDSQDRSRLRQCQTLPAS